MQTAIANRLLTVIIVPPNGYRAVPQKHIHQWIPQLHASTDQHFQLSHMFQDRAALGVSGQSSTWAILFFAFLNHTTLKC